MIETLLIVGTAGYCAWALLEQRRRRQREEAARQEQVRREEQSAEQLRREQEAKEKRDRCERLRCEEEARREQQTRQEREREEQASQECEKKLTRLLVGRFALIDSNVWMNDDSDYELLFAAIEDILRRSKTVQLLFGPQFDEICNIKKDYRLTHPKGRRARLAINRIARWQEMKLLDIKPITLDAKPGVYADPLILRLLAVAGRKGQAVALLSDDKELRVRAKAILSFLGVEDSEALEAREVAAESRDYCNFHKIYR